MSQLFSKRQLFSKLSLSVIFLLILVVFYSAWQNLTTLVSFSTAYLLGLLFLFFDEQFLYRFYLEKIDIKVSSDSHFPQLISRNFLFLLSLPLLSIFVLTSSGSLLGIALLLSLNFYLLIEMWQLSSQPLLFKDRFLEMAKLNLDPKIVQQICLAASSYFIFLLIILVF